jgi:hypothetical protein
MARPILRTFFIKNYTIKEEVLIKEFLKKKG